MKYKLTLREMTALKLLFEAMVVRQEKCPDYYECLLRTLMLALYKKLYVQALFVRRAYTITLSEEVAIGFVLFWSEFDLSLAPFENNIINRMIAGIDKKLAGNIRSQKSLAQPLTTNN